MSKKVFEQTADVEPGGLDVARRECSGGNSDDRGSEVTRIKLVREQFYYPIIMPLDADGNGPASVENGEARKITFEVWDRELTSHGSFDLLPDAIDKANELNAARDENAEALHKSFLATEDGEYNGNAPAVPNEITRAQDNTWKQFAGDFNSMSDEEVEDARQVAQNDLEEAEEWLEAVASWEAAGKPRGTTIWE